MFLIEVSLWVKLVKEPVAARPGFPHTFFSASLGGTADAEAGASIRQVVHQSNSWIGHDGGGKHTKPPLVDS